MTEVSHGLTLTVLVVLAALLVAVLGIWWWGWRESFTRRVLWSLRGAWRSRMVYGFAWQPAMVTTGLAVNLDGNEYLPKLLRVSSTGCVDRVWVRMLPGQVFDDWSAQSERLAQTFGVQDCRVRTTRVRHRLELWFLITDPLTDPIRPVPLRPARVPRRFLVSMPGRTPTSTARSTVHPWIWRGCRSGCVRTAPPTGSGCWAPTSWWSARPAPGRGR